MTRPPAIPEAVPGRATIEDAASRLPATRPAAELERLRRRTVWSLVGGVALGSTGQIAAIVASTIVAEELAGSAAWSGVPGAAVVLGAAIGSVALAALMVRRGRRTGIVTGHIIATAGAILATAGIIGGSLSVFIVATLLIGFGNASNQQSRYVAADLYPDERRATGIGIVVWGATVGAIIGPNLVAPAGQLALRLGLPEMTGAYILPALFVGAAALLSWAMLRPDPYELADVSILEHRAAGGDRSTAISLASVFRRPHVPVAMVALVTGQFVMVLIMTMTPLHMREHDHDLASVGFVISAHTFGMFGLSPISGRLTDRFGSVPVILAGLAVIAASGILAAAAPPDGGAMLLVALFLLGYGWNLGFVAGSALLTTGLTLGERTRVQGLTDALIWSSAAIASLGSGVVLATAGFAALSLLGTALVTVPVLLFIVRRGALADSLRPATPSD